MTVLCLWKLSSNILGVNGVAKEEKPPKQCKLRLEFAFKYLEMLNYIGLQSGGKRNSRMYQVFG